MKTLAERFWEKVEVHGPKECWPWKASIFRSGYGCFALTSSKNIGAHCMAYRLTKGSVPAGLDVLHSCDNRPCCNPNHLWPGTDLDNVRDCIAKGRAIKARGERNGAYTHPEQMPRGERHGRRTHPERTARGERQGSAKLTEARVREARRLFAEGNTLAAIGRLMGVWPQTIGRIMRGKSWTQRPDVIEEDGQRLGAVYEQADAALRGSEEINLLREEQTLAEKGA